MLWEHHIAEVDERQAASLNATSVAAGMGDTKAWDILK